MSFRWTTSCWIFAIFALVNQTVLVNKSSLSIVVLLHFVHSLAWIHRSLTRLYTPFTHSPGYTVVQRSTLFIDIRDWCCSVIKWGVQIQK
jgi:hypothetical protein